MRRTARVFLGSCGLPSHALVDLNDVTFQVEILEPEAGELAWTHAGFRRYPLQQPLRIYGPAGGAIDSEPVIAQYGVVRYIG